MHFKMTLESLLHFVAKKDQHDSQLALAFVPKHNDCAVYDLYYLLSGNIQDKRLEFIFLDSLNSMDTLFTKDYSNRYRKTTIFGHYYPNFINLETYNNGIAPTQWKSVFTRKHQLLHCHVCYGVNLMKKFKLNNWVSYKKEVSLLFGIEDTNERLIIFFNEVFNLILLESKSSVLLNKLKSLYIQEMIYLEENASSFVGYNGLLKDLYAAYNSLSNS